MRKFSIYLGQRKTASEIGIESRARKVLEILSDKGPLAGSEIADLCSFKSRMIAAGAIAVLVRRKAVEGIPAAYRITETGRSILAAMTTESVEAQPRKEGKSSRELQGEPSGQGEQSP